MKRVADSTQPVTSFFFTLFFIVALTIAGCSANTISGPEAAPSDDPMVQAPLPDAAPNAPHNEHKEEDNKHKTNGDTHN